MDSKECTKWIKFEDERPEEGQFVLIQPKSRGDLPYVGRFHYNTDGSYDMGRLHHCLDGSYNVYCITARGSSKKGLKPYAWMPLPDPCE